VRRPQSDAEESTEGPLEGYAGAALLLGDLRIALLLLNEARYRVLRRYLGITRDQANAITLIALLMLVEAAGERAVRVRQAIPHPTATGTACGATVTSEVVFGLLGGVPARDARLAGTLVLIVLTARELRASGRGAIDGIRSWSRSTLRAFNLRYHRQSA
jgi:hypothetical protein